MSEYQGSKILISTPLHYCYIEEKLAEAEAQAKDPNTKWLKHEEVWEKLRKKYEL